MKVVTRVEAKSLGLSRYYTGKTCSRGHVDERYVCSAVCVSCSRINTLAWAQENPARWLAHMSFHEMRRNGYASAIVEGVGVDAVFPFYARARSLTLKTGEPHEVDHIVPLSRGGKHHPENLQVITRTANRSKGTR